MALWGEILCAILVKDSETLWGDTVCGIVWRDSVLHCGIETMWVIVGEILCLVLWSRDSVWYCGERF